MESQSQKTQINAELDHSKEAFYANEFSIWVRNTETLIDFRQALPRGDVLPNGDFIPSLVNKHQPIAIPVLTAKMLIIILKEQLEEFEKKNGEIRLPDNWRIKPKPADKSGETGSGLGASSSFR